MSCPKWACAPGAAGCVGKPVPSDTKADCLWTLLGEALLGRSLGGRLPCWRGRYLGPQAASSFHHSHGTQGALCAPLSPASARVSTVLLGAPSVPEFPPLSAPLPAVHQPLLPHQPDLCCIRLSR